MFEFYTILCLSKVPYVSGVQNAGMKVLHVWLDEQSETQKVPLRPILKRTS